MTSKIEEMRPPWLGWMNYDDVGKVLELGATFDDILKKNGRFLVYSVKVANRILEDLGIKARVTWGKWGGRLDPDEKENHAYSYDDLEKIGHQIIKHRSWKALLESTYVFTYGKSEEEWLAEQSRNWKK